MAISGQISLYLAMVACLFSIVFYLVGAKKKNVSLVNAGRIGIFITLGFTTLSIAILLYAFITLNFQFEYVASYTSSDIPLHYRLIAIWAGSSGSLLFWAWLLVLCTAIGVVRKKQDVHSLTPYASAIIMIVELFFLCMVAFISTPFTALPVPPVDGNGLSPALRNPAMLIHPPLVLVSYAASAIPFAFAISGLITKKLGVELNIIMRRWALLLWVFIGMGTICGGWWAYGVLGWGGYWAWDPLENAGLMPWLMLTAFLHTNMRRKNKPLPQVWNILLIVSVFFLTIFGTFLTRSGVARSVHAYAQSGQGNIWVSFLVLILVFSLIMLWYRRKELKNESMVPSLFSRESLSLITSLLMVVITYIVFLGTLIPVIRSVIQGERPSLDPAFFNNTTGPIFLLILLLIGICVFIGSRIVRQRRPLFNYLPPLAIAIIVGVGLYFSGIGNGLAIFAFAICSFALTSIVLSWASEVTAYNSNGFNYLKIFWESFRKDRVHYGAYIVHIAIVVMAVSIIGSSFYKVEEKVDLMPGESVTVQRYSFEFRDINQAAASELPDLTADLVVSKNGKEVRTMNPRLYFYDKTKRMYPDIAISSTLREDLYIVLTGVGDDGSASFTIAVNPLVIWLWIGAGILLLGGLLGLSVNDNRIRASSEQNDFVAEDKD